TAGLNINKPSGTVDAGTTNLSINGFTLSSGTFTSTTGVLTVRGNFTHTAGGTFNLNGGAVVVGGSGNRTWDVAGSETFNNFTVNMTGNSDTLTVASGDTLVVTGLLTHTNGLINGPGTIEAQGNVSVAGTADGGNGTISFLVAGNQTITGNGGLTAGLNINKPSGTVDAGTTNLSINGFTLSSGTFTSTTGVLTVRGNFTQQRGYADDCCRGHAGGDGHPHVDQWHRQRRHP
ncbi:MAG: hypothetical protein HY211_06405, partial [Candidatus Omnitrophica bacterium]|nr:hypothetical protein [Candidatus Omnitrophota bacterium]